MFEERGIPGIALVTEPFRQTATAMATTWGRADHLLPLVLALLTAP